MILRRSSSRCSRNPMVGMSSLTGSFTDEDADASGIGSYFRRGRRLGIRRRFGGGRVGDLSRSQPFGRRRIEDAARQRSQPRMNRRQNLGLNARLNRANLRLDLRLELIGGPLELIHKAPDLASHFRQFLGPENK